MYVVYTNSALVDISKQFFKVIIPVHFLPDHFIIFPVDFDIITVNILVDLGIGK